MQDAEQDDACLAQGTRTNPLKNDPFREEGNSNSSLSVSFSRYIREKGGVQRELDTSLINTWRKRIFLFLSRNGIAYKDKRELTTN